jgi:hypothetical protein
MKRTDPQFKLRLPTALKEKVDKAADNGSRTTSNEIIRRLEWSFAAEEVGASTTPEATALFMVPVPDHDKRLSSVEAAVLGIMTELEKIKETLEKGDQRNRNSVASADR